MTHERVNPAPEWLVLVIARSLFGLFSRLWSLTHRSQITHASTHIIVIRHALRVRYQASRSS